MGQSFYQAHEKWAVRKKNFILIEIGLLFLRVLLSIFDLPLMKALLVILTMVVIPLVIIVAMLMKRSNAKSYEYHIEHTRSKTKKLERDFAKICQEHFNAIDELYLMSLEPMQRELVLLRREHKETLVQLQKSQKMLLQSERERISEQKRTREVTEELLRIEKERERRMGY